jgi:hypothetical protein
MKLGIIYNTFEGTELLEASIKEIRDCADFIILNCQTQSYYGQHIRKEDLTLIDFLQSSKLVDIVLNFNCASYGGFASDPYQAKILERAKRENGRILAKINDCTHFIQMDVDEFYRKEDFIKAKQFIEDRDIWFSACPIKEHINKPTLQLDGYEDIYVPFICKMGDHLSYKLGGDFVAITDPTRWYNSVGYSSYKFRPDELCMYHFNNVRKDLSWKYQVTSRSNLDRQKIPQIVDSILMLKEGDSFKNRKIIQVPNYFNIEIKK